MHISSLGTRSLDRRPLVLVRKFVKNRRDKQNSDLNLTNTRLRVRLERATKGERGRNKDEKGDRLLQITEKEMTENGGTSLSKKIFHGKFFEKRNIYI